MLRQAAPKRLDPRLGLAGRSRRAMAEAASAGRRHRLHPRAEGPGGARGSTRRPRSGARPARLARGAARDDRRRTSGARSGCATRSSTRRCRRSPNAASLLLAPRPRRVRRALRPPARARPRGEAEAVPQAEAAGRRHLSPAAPGGGGPAFRLLHRRRVRRRAAASRPIRTCASSSSAAPACSRPTATSARSSCSGTASGPMCSTTAST